MIIQDNIIKAEGKLLYYPAENTVWGKAARLAIYKGHRLTVEDFSEIDETNAVKIEGVYYAQIALMLNYQEFPDQYQEKYNEMQEWRKFTKEVRFTEKQEEIIWT